MGPVTVPLLPAPLSPLPTEHLDRIHTDVRSSFDQACELKLTSTIRCRPVSIGSVYGWELTLRGARGIYLLKSVEDGWQMRVAFDLLSTLFDQAGVANEWLLANAADLALFDEWALAELSED